MSYDEYFSWRRTVCGDNASIAAGLKLLTNKQLKQHIKTVLPFAASERLISGYSGVFTTVLVAMQAILRERTYKA